MEDETQMTDMQSLLQEQYLKSLAGIEDGQIVTGTVVQLNNDYVFVDVGYKSEGKIPVDEFIELPKVGDKVNVAIINKEGKGGQVIVFVNALKARDHNDIMAVDFRAQTVCLNGFNTRHTVSGACIEACLPAEQRHHRTAELFNRHGK